RRPGEPEVGDVEARERRAAGYAALVLANALTDALAPGVVAGHRKAEAVLEIEPADLAVGHDVKADAFLERQMPLYAFELHGGEFMAGKRVALHPCARVFPRRRAQQAAHDVGADAIEVSHA